MREIAREHRIERLRQENPWWSPPHRVPGRFREARPRPYVDLFYPLVMERRFRRALVLMGPRRVGKTWMLHHVIERMIEQERIDPGKICYVSLDIPLFTGMGLDEIVKLFESASEVNCAAEQVFFFFDEIQYLHGWEQHLKVIVDRMDQVKCIASGSAAAALKMKSVESGTGRFTDFFLPPLTFFEYRTLLREKRPDLFSHGASGIEAMNRDFVDYINFGGYPEVAYAETRDNTLVRSDIIEKVLLKDLPSLYGIQDTTELNHLFNVLAYNTGDEVSLDELSPNSNVSKATIKKYLEYLESAFLIQKIQRIDQNARRFRRENFFKIYLTNTAMRAALFSPVSENDEAIGHLVETAIFSQYFYTIKSNYYARWNKGEVDLVCLNQQFKPDFACEIKWSDRYPDRPSDLSNLIDFCHRNNLKQALVTTKSVGRIVDYKSVELRFMPASVLCDLIGKAIIHATNKTMKEILDLSADLFGERAE